MSTWPFPGDSPIAQARRIARAYRAAALAADPVGEVGRLDGQCAGWGQGWVAPSMVLHDLDDMLTPQQAADVAAVRVATIRQLRLRGRLAGVKAPGGSWRYRYRDVLDVCSVTRGR